MTRPGVAPPGMTMDSPDFDNTLVPDFEPYRLDPGELPRETRLCEETAELARTGGTLICVLTRDHLEWRPHLDPEGVWWWPEEEARRDRPDVPSKRRSTMPTLNDVISRHGFDVLDQLDRQATIPYLDGLQPQGDTIIIPLAEVSSRVTFSGPGKPIPRTGVAVVEAAGGSHEHRLFADQGTCYWQPDVTDSEGLAIGVLTVPSDALAVQAHPEHGYAGIAPGMFVIGRQREQADVQRLVAD